LGQVIGNWLCRYLGRGVMEYWNVGILGLSELDLFHMDGTDQKIKSDHHPLLIPNIPFFHFSIIPWVL
jgi:hypothetical protein